MENAVKQYIEKTVLDVVEGLKQNAAEYADSHDHEYDGSYANARKVLWEDTDSRDMAYVCGQVGVLVGLFDLAKELKITLCAEVEALGEWATVIDAVTQ